ARAVARQREIAIRLSLGAGPLRLLRMLLTESVMLAAIGGILGAYLAWRIPTIIVGLVPYSSPPVYSLKPDWIVFAHLAAITFMSGCLAGLAPAAGSLKA